MKSSSILEFDVSMEGNSTVPILFSLATILFICFGAGTSFAASVKDVNTGKSQIVVDLEGMSVNKGDRLCVFTSKNKKIDCGSVTSSKSGTAFVKFSSKKRMKRIKKGFKVDSETGGDSAGKTADKSSFKLWLGWAPAIFSPTVFNKVGYIAPSSDTPTTLWESDGVVKQTLAGFGLQAGFGVGSLTIIPGLRYRIFSPNRVDADYVPKRENPYVSTTTSATVIGFYTDVAFLNFSMGSIGGIYVTSGLDADMSTVSVKAEKKDDTGATAEGPVADAKSSLTVLSLRVGAGLDLIPFKPFGASIGLNVLVPLVELGKKFEGNLAENESRGVQDAGNDFKNAVGHKKNGFGLDLQASVLLAF